MILLRDGNEKSLSWNSNVPLVSAAKQGWECFIFFLKPLQSAFLVFRRGFTFFLFWFLILEVGVLCLAWCLFFGFWFIDESFFVLLSQPIIKFYYIFFDIPLKTCLYSFYFMPHFLLLPFKLGFCSPRGKETTCFSPSSLALSSLCQSRLFLFFILFFRWCKVYIG